MRKIIQGCCWILVSLVCAGTATAGDLGWAGAASGMGQALGNGLAQMNQGIIQMGLEEERRKQDRLDREQVSNEQAAQRNANEREQKINREAGELNMQPDYAQRQTSNQELAELVRLRGLLERITAVINQNSTVINLHAATLNRRAQELRNEPIDSLAQRVFGAEAAAHEARVRAQSDIVAVFNAR